MGFVKRLFGAAALATAALLIGAAPVPAQIVPCGVVNPCEPNPPAPTPPQPSNPGTGTPQAQSIQITVEDDTLVYGEETKITVTGGDSISTSTGSGSISQEPVRRYLMESRWPYTSEVVVGEVFSSEIMVRPQLNTRYRAVSNRGTSNVVQVITQANVRSFKVKVLPRFRVKMSLAITFPPEFATPLGGQRVHWYIVRGKRATQIGTSRTRSRGDTQMRALIRARVPKGRYKFFGAFCIDQPLGVDLGLGLPARRRCP